MQEIPPILRRNIKYNRLIQSTILICSMTLLITSAASNNNKVEQKVKKEVTYEAVMLDSRLKSKEKNILHKIKIEKNRGILLKNKE